MPNHGAHSSLSPGSVQNTDTSTTTTTSPGRHASTKLLVTRRSWMANSTWAKLPIRPHVFQPKYTKSDRESPLAAWITGDTVDASIPLYPVTTQLSTTVANTTALPAPQLPSSASLPISVTQEPCSDDTATHKALEDFLRVHRFRPYQMIFFFISVMTYIFDVGSDAYLVFSYHKQGDYYWAWLTLALLIIPAFVMTAFSLAWYVLDRKVAVDPPRTGRAWTLRLFFHGLQLAPLVRLADSVYYGIVSRRPDLSLAMTVQYTRLMLYEDADSAMLRMIECFMEAAPQLLLQLYIIFTQETPIGTAQVIAQVVSCFTSWLSLAWSLTHYQNALRSSRVEKANLTAVGSLLFFFWKAGMLASRILAMALFAAVARGIWFTVTMGVHWIIAVGWLITHGTTFCSPVPRTVVEILFDLVLGAIYCFDVVNIREGHSRLWYLTCYTVLALENMAMGLVWALFAYPRLPDSATVGALVTEAFQPLKKWSIRLFRQPNVSTWVQELPSWLLPSAVVFSFLFGLFMMLAYYMCAHPSRDIRFCISCNLLLQCGDAHPSPTRCSHPITEVKRSSDTDASNQLDTQFEPIETG